MRGTCVREESKDARKYGLNSKLGRDWQWRRALCILVWVLREMGEERSGLCFREGEKACARALLRWAEELACDWGWQAMDRARRRPMACSAARVDSRRKATGGLSKWAEV